MGICFAAALAVVSVAADKDKDEAFIGSRGKYWAYQKAVRPPVPALQDSWIQTPVDAFILKALQDKHLTPSKALGKTQLLRRVTYDLIGLPPTPSEVAAFLEDNSPAAYKTVVERLLASPHYGERWALKWLDTVRWAETNGFELDQDRPHAWRYRDYVINAFNDDKPYDRFIKEQIAGDEMFPGNKEALIATGYLRAGSQRVSNNPVEADEIRQDVLTEIATNIGQTFLGMTVNCARCHNHKFDPILQADFYRLQAIFAGRVGKEIDIATPEEKAASEAAAKAYADRLEPIDAALKALAKPYQDKLRAANLLKLDPSLKEVLEIPADKRTPAQKDLAKLAEARIKPAWDEVVDIMSDADKSERLKWRAQLNALKLEIPDPAPMAFSLVTGDSAPQSYVLRLGDVHNRLDPIDPGVPTVIQAATQQKRVYLCPMIDCLKT